MKFEPTRTYRLVGTGRAGLAWGDRGVALGGVPLAWAQDGDDGALKWRARSRGELGDILDTAYGPQPSAVADRCHRALRRIVAQFEAGDLALAGIEAVMLRLPPIDPDRMAKLAATEFRRGGDAWEDEPRLPAGQPGGGRWTAGGGTSSGPQPKRPSVSANDRSQSARSLEPSGDRAGSSDNASGGIVVPSRVRESRRQNPSGFYSNSAGGGTFYIPTMVGGQPVKPTEVHALNPAAFQVGWNGDGKIELKDAEGRVYQTGTTPAELQSFNATTGRALGVAIYTHPDIPLGSPDSPPTPEEQRQFAEARAAWRAGVQASLNSPSGQLTTFVGEELVEFPFFALMPLEAAAAPELDLNTAEGVWPTREGVAVSGGRAIDSAKAYEAGVRALYPEVSQQARTFRSLVNGRWLNGKADTAAAILDKNTGVEAKYVRNWHKSILNPNSKIANKSFAISARRRALLQAQKYSGGFEGGAVYHTNSVEFASYYYRVFLDAGIDNIRFIITPIAAP